MFYKPMSISRTTQLCCGLDRAKRQTFKMGIHINNLISFVWLTIGVLLTGINWTESRQLMRTNPQSDIGHSSKSSVTQRSNKTVQLGDTGTKSGTTLDLTPDVTLPSNHISDAVPTKDTDTQTEPLLDLTSDITLPSNQSSDAVPPHYTDTRTAPPSALTSDVTLPSKQIADAVQLTDTTSGMTFESTSATTMLDLSAGFGMYCTSKDDIVIVFNGLTTSPRIVDLTNDRVCLRWQGRDVVIVTCGVQTTTPSRGVAMVIEHDDENVYSLASVTCPSRSPRATIDVMVGKERQKLGKARAHMQIGMKYNNISDLHIKCHPTGNVFVTYFPDDSTNHIFAYNSGGNACDALQIRKDIVQISGCNSRDTIEIAFSSVEITDKIIGGSGMLRIYKFSCSAIGKDPVFFGKVPNVLLLGGTSGLATWSSLIYASLICVVVVCCMMN